MKMIVCFCVMFLSMPAFSQNKNSITFDVGEIVNQNGFYNSNFKVGSYDDYGGKKGMSGSVLINYAREIIPQLQTRFILGYSKKADRYDASNDSYEITEKLTYGLGVIYNFQADVTNSLFLGLTFINQSVDYLKEDYPVSDTDTHGTGVASTYMLDFGKRVKIGTLGDVVFSWTPTLSYNYSNYSKKVANAFSNVGAGSPHKTGELKFNLLKMDAFF